MRLRYGFQFVLALLALAAAGGCVSSPPKGLEPVDGFEIDRYLGTWYEIARLDHSFERNLSHVTAEYAPCDCPEGIDVINRGYNEKTGEWKSATGSAKFIGPRDVGALKVTFFWPFYAPYYVIALDREGYEWAMVTSGSREYLWILAREPEMDEAVLTRLLRQADAWDFATEELIFPSHE